MNLFDVYPLFNIEIVKGKGCHVWDTEGNEYLDLYGGHAVISVGHSHPTYVKAITEQVNIGSIALSMSSIPTPSSTVSNRNWQTNWVRHPVMTTIRSS